jgi:hypothetical protein
MLQQGISFKGIHKSAVITIDPGYKFPPVSSLHKLLQHPDAACFVL